MRFEDFEDQGRALEQDEQLARAEDLIDGEQQMREMQEMQAAQEARARTAQYRCATEGCSGDLDAPWSVCDNCLAVARLEANLEQALTALHADPSPWHVQAPSGERYYANASDAAHWRQVESERLARHLARVHRVQAECRADLAQALSVNAFLSGRFDLTDAGRAALSPSDANATPAERTTLRPTLPVTV